MTNPTAPTPTPTPTPVTNIIIVGGGIAGLSLAAHLLYNGINCCIYERKSREELLHLTDTDATDTFYDISACGIQALLRIANGNIAPSIFHNAIAYDTITFYKTNTSSSNNPFLVNVKWKSRSLGFPMFNITRTNLLKCLIETVEKLNPNAIQYSSNVQLIDSMNGIVQIAQQGPTSNNKGNMLVLQANLIVGADGVHSRLRKYAFGDLGLRSDGIVAYYAVLPPLAELAELQAGQADDKEDKGDKEEETQTMAGNTSPGSYAICGMEANYFQYAVISPTASFWYVNFILDENKPYIQLPECDPVVGGGDNGDGGSSSWLDEVKKRMKQKKGRKIPIMETLIQNTKETDIQVIACYDREPLQRYTKGKLVLIGDAAHPFTPYAGLGASQAMVDAFTLGEAIINEVTEAKKEESEDDSNKIASFQDAIQTYEQQRLKEANECMNLSRDICNPSFMSWLMMEILWFFFWIASMFGDPEIICDTFMTIDKNSMVNDLIPFKNEQDKQAYEERYNDAMVILKSKLNVKTT